MKSLMIAGTGSNVGKSLLVSGLCRLLRNDGYHPAPFKAQNMALNSYITADGLEIGRAQAVQAEAARIECLAEMNPILLKPIGECTSQVILNGKPLGNRSAKEYFNKAGRDVFKKAAKAAYDRLSKLYSPIIMEGAGSIAELNLMHLDIVNMPMAKDADAAVILVADISQGGVFASAYGSIMLQKPEDRARIKGIIVNKFRGDKALFSTGLQQLEEICGVPVIGVMPFLKDLNIEEEDSYFYKRTTRCETKEKINIAVIKLPHISNFTDFDPLEARPDVNLYYTLNKNDILKSDIIIIPGTKATISDLKSLYDNGVAQCIKDCHAQGKHIIGICGGYQAMGLRINDPAHIEGPMESIKGLGLLPTETTICDKKTTRRCGFTPLDTKNECYGYEIHMGKTKILSNAQPYAILNDGIFDGCKVSNRCWGTYMHGLFENHSILNDLLSTFKGFLASEMDYKAYKESQYERLASEMRKNLDIDLIYKILNEHD